jgi:hypothetical protein
LDESRPEKIEVSPSDTATNYSVDSHLTDLENDYIRAFSQQLAQDLETSLGPTKLSKISSSYISEVMRVFTRKLHEESTNPFQWGVSVALHRKRE